MTSNPNNGYAPQSVGALVLNFKKNFLQKSIEIVPGLTFNQYETVKQTYFYMHNQFQSGMEDENGDPKYFYDMITDRNDQATKNIQLDTKDVYIKAETEGAELKSWLLRREFVGYAKTTSFGMKLNELADDLPDFGTVVWKKIKDQDGKTDTKQVELINLMNDPKVKKLKDGIVIERHVMTQYEMKLKKSWNQATVDALIQSGRTVAGVPFLDEPNVSEYARAGSRIDETTPFYEVYEFWGEMPRDLYEAAKTGGLPRKEVAGMPDRSAFYQEGRSKAGVGTSPVDAKIRPYVEDVKGSQMITPTYGSNETVYAMAIVANIGEGDQEKVLFCKEVDRSLFPYKEVHFRRRKGRWLGVGNYEQCFPLIEKANELTNRFFGALRLALTQLYQTRDELYAKNITQDLLNGDIVVSRSELTALATEIRGGADYTNELNRIESKADRLCNSFEIVTGENLPSGTPFKLGAQQLKTATKLFEYVQQNMGLFIEEVFNEWLLPDFASSLTEEHIMDLVDDADDLEVYFDAKRKLFQYEVMKRYVLETNTMPDPQQLAMVGQLAKDSIKKGPKQVKVERDYYTDLKFSIKTVVTGENDAKKENLETISSLTEIAMANPAGLQDPRLMKLVNIVLEQSGYSPLEIMGINQTETNPMLNPAMQGGSPASNGTSPSAVADRGGGGAPIPAGMPAGMGAGA